VGDRTVGECDSLLRHGSTMEALDLIWLLRGDAQATEATKTAKAAAMQQVKIGVAEHTSWTSVRGGSGPSLGRSYFSGWGSSMSGPWVVRRS